MHSFRNSTVLASISFIALSLSGRAQTNTWTGADPSGYWSAPANWSPAGVPVNGNDLVFPGGLPPGDMVSTNDLTGSFFRSIGFTQAGGHTIRGNPITLTNRSNCIINNGTNVIACDLTFSGTPSTPEYQSRTISSSSFPVGELTVLGNVGGGSLYVHLMRVVIRGQFTGGSLRVWGGTLALYGDDPSAASAEVQNSSTLLVQGSRPNLNITTFWEFESAACPYLRGDGVVGDVLGCGYIIPDSTLSVKSLGGQGASQYGWRYLVIPLNGTNVGEYGRLISSGDVTLSGGSLSPSPGFNPRPGQVFTIVEKTSPGAITNPFLGPEGTVTTLNGRPFRISYVGGDGNDVTLTATPPFSDANWISMAGISGPNGQVTAAVVDGSGNLYIGGIFTMAGNVFATNIAKWNGSSWSALGSGMNDIVYALAVSGSNLYAGGRFTRAGGILVNRIAKWDGSTWTALGSGCGAASISILCPRLYMRWRFPAAICMREAFSARRARATSIRLPNGTAAVGPRSAQE